MRNKIQVISFDADDTLWVNLPHFLKTEKEFCALLQDYLPEAEVGRKLFETEMKNLHLYGYGVKGFVLCMIETICSISSGATKVGLIENVIQLGKELLQQPIELLGGVEQTLERLKEKYRLIVATKGDLLDQERKIQQSGLQNYFHHIEIMSDKRTADYRKLLQHLDCRPENFLMLGNSIKSDIAPVLELGGFAAHIPYHTTWQHEQHDEPISHPHFIKLSRLDEILNYLD